jgi:RNA recognition motif-containing protein
MQIFIGNLNRMTTARHLAELFLPFGMVHTVKIISDGMTGHSLGYGYIEMEPNCGKLAVQRLDHRLFMNYYMEVNEVD